jgi:type IV pilus assembly protein PilE
VNAYRPSRQDGFTLVELMITVVVVSILASLSYGAYTEQLAKSRRAAARAMIMDVLQHEERFFTENNTYTTDLTQMGYPATLHTDRDGHNITLAAGATGAIATSVAVTATALITDAKCTSLTLSSANAQTGAGSQSAVCWR